VLPGEDVDDAFDGLAADELLTDLANHPSSL
jgi:hypothetical protein